MPKPPFDPAEDYDVQVDFAIDGPVHRRGTAFDKSLVSTRMLRRLYDIGLVRIRPKGKPQPELASAARTLGPIRFVPMPRRARR